jgi:hypothetical protein
VTAAPSTPATTQDFELDPEFLVQVARRVADISWADPSASGTSLKQARNRVINANTRAHLAIAARFADHIRRLDGVIDVLASTDGADFIVYVITDDLDMKRELHLQALFIEEMAGSEAPSGDLVVLTPDDDRPASAVAV